MATRKLTRASFSSSSSQPLRSMFPQKRLANLDRCFNKLGMLLVVVGLQLLLLAAPPALCGAWMQWEAWSDCDVTCRGSDGNAGTRTAKRPCWNAYSAPCEGDALRRESCEHVICDCDAWSAWGSWRECGQQTCKRNTARTCLATNLSTVAKCCPRDQEKRDEYCDLGDHCCLILAQWAQWRNWTQCGSDCQRTRTRGCLMRPYCSLDKYPNACGAATESSQTERCVGGECRCSFNWASWEEWSDCEDGCRCRTRRRDCIVEGEEPCPRLRKWCGDTSQETQDCEGATGAWSSWSTCSVTCGQGTQTRTNWNSGEGGPEQKACQNYPCSEDVVNNTNANNTNANNTDNNNTDVNNEDDNYGDLFSQGAATADSAPTLLWTVLGPIIGVALVSVLVLSAYAYVKTKRERQLRQEILQLRQSLGNDFLDEPRWSWSVAYLEDDERRRSLDNRSQTLAGHGNEGELPLSQAINARDRPLANDVQMKFTVTRAPGTNNEDSSTSSESMVESSFAESSVSEVTQS